MLPKNERLSRLSFPQKRPTKRYSLPWGSLSLYESSDFRASVVVSKKVLKKAHERNRLKRRIYSALEELQKESSHKIMLVVYPRAEALTLPLRHIVKDLQSALR